MDIIDEEQEVQISVPFAIVHGNSISELPKDLYIPPDALKVFLEAFEGPLDLLLYFIKRQNLDILNIPVADITHQYLEYIELMREMEIELAAEYLLMAAMLAEIKSRMLLPRAQELEGTEEDPRAELIRRLQEYECFKRAAVTLAESPQEGRDVFSVSVDSNTNIERPVPQTELRELILALKDVMQRAKVVDNHHIKKEPLSISKRMSYILSALNQDNFVEFSSFFNAAEGRLGVVVTFLAILELLKQSLIDVVQKDSFSTIHIKLNNRAEEL